MLRRRADYRGIYDRVRAEVDQGDRAQGWRTPVATAGGRGSSRVGIDRAAQISVDSILAIWRDSHAIGRSAGDHRLTTIGHLRAIDVEDANSVAAAFHHE